MAERVPQYVRKFADAILMRPPTDVTLVVPRTTRQIQGSRGILTTSVFNYSERPFNLLGRSLEYTFWIEPVRAYRGTEISLQLYKNFKGYWRLFAYNREGMLLSLNLSMTRRRGSILQLGQTIAMRARDMSAEDRQRRASEATASLRRMGFDVSQRNELVFGTFDAERATFLDTTPAGFVAGFLHAALVVGYFQGNKGYSLPRSLGVTSTRRLSTTERSLSRSIPAGLRWDVLERDRSTCQKCGRTPKKDGVILHIDHVTAYSQGGPTVYENLRVLCSRCNLGRGNRSNK